jgi:hypothetical protein
VYGEWSTQQSARQGAGLFIVPEQHLAIYDRRQKTGRFLFEAPRAGRHTAANPIGRRWFRGE